MDSIASGHGGGESDPQRLKRVKAAERQRRKRERDKAAQLGMPYTGEDQSSQSSPDWTPLTPDEQNRRDKVREAARQRQRKHRALVKQRKMQELGLDMGNEIIPGIDSGMVHFRGNVADTPGFNGIIPPGVTLASAMGAEPEPPFPPNQQHAGATFATTILLSFSCAPLLKQHLLRTLNMTNEELASLEPIIADAWDQWDQQRRMQFEHRVVAGGPSAPFPVELSQDPSTAGHPAFLTEGGPTNEFRERFARTLMTPLPPNFTHPPPIPAAGAPTPDAIDPHLSSSTASST